MALFEVVTTTPRLEKLSRKISEEIASPPSETEQTEDGKAKMKTEVPTKDGMARTEGLKLFEIPWTDNMNNFTSELPKAIVCTRELYCQDRLLTMFQAKDVQRLVEEIAGRKIRKARPNEHKLPPAVFQAEAVSPQRSGWLETKQHEVVIVQPFPNPNGMPHEAKMQLRSVSAGKGVYETEMLYGSIILVFGNVRFQPVPFETPFFMLKFLTDLTEGEDVV